MKFKNVCSSIEANKIIGPQASPKTENQCENQNLGEACRSRMLQRLKNI